MIIIVLDVKDKILAKRIKYAFSQIMLYLGYEYEIRHNLDKNAINGKKCPLLVYYGDKPLNLKDKKSIQIISSKQETGKKQEKLYYFRDKNTAIFYYDFVLDSFSILAREEEIESKSIDKHQRFTAEKSKIFRYLKEPVVNKYAIILDKLIRKLHDAPLIQKCHWPENKEFAACLTHDVDIVKFRKSDIFDINKIIDFIAGKNPYWQFNNVIGLEKKYDFDSTFFFCTGKKHNFDPNYSIKEKVMYSSIRHIMNEGNEIGLHLSYLSYDSNEMMSAEKRELSNIVNGRIGVRTHFLRFKAPDTWVLEDKSGFYYDSSLGYSSHIGYRSGFCWPYNPYAIGREDGLGIFELPLSVMDSALFEKNKTPGNALKSLKKLFRNVQKFNGVIVMNWHQRVFNEKYFHGWTFVYKKCLDYFKEENAFVGSARKIIDWVSKRNSVSIREGFNGNNVKFIIKSRTGINGFAIKVSSKNTILKMENSKNYKIINNKGGFIVIFKEIESNHKISIELTKELIKS